MGFMKKGVLLNADIDTIENVAEIETEGMSILWFEFAVTVAALSAFTIELQLASGGNWIQVAAASGDYTSPVHPMIRASGNLAAAGTSGVHWAKLDVTGVYKVRLKAAGTSSSLVGKYSLG